MRFKKGTKVEVLSKREVPSGSWWCAEIISSNDHTYEVRYDQCMTYTGPAVERVPRNAIRSCPPFKEGPKYWVPSDIVEVFDNYSWKLAEVSRVFGRNCFIVRLLGSSMEFRARSSNIRMRQAWQDNKWVVIQKDSVNCHNGTRNMLAKGGKSICQKTKISAKKCMKKRLHACVLLEETCEGAGKKIRTIEKEGSNHRLTAANSTNIREKVDQMLGEEQVQALNNITSEFLLKNSAGNCYFRASSEPNETESASSSVGSCSGNNSPFRPLHYSVNGLTQDVDSCSSDAETFCLGRELPLNTEKSLREDIHQLELHAYKKTLMALYASGPISWDQEALMTNLRCMLHISNDEHLLQVRNLISAENDVSIR